jgi:hypothetical protein
LYLVANGERPVHASVLNVTQFSLIRVAPRRVPRSARGFGIRQFFRCCCYLL